MNLGVQVSALFWMLTVFKRTATPGSNIIGLLRAARGKEFMHNERAVSRMPRMPACSSSGGNNPRRRSHSSFSHRNVLFFIPSRLWSIRGLAGDIARPQQKLLSVLRKQTEECRSGFSWSWALEQARPLKDQLGCLQRKSVVWIKKKSKVISWTFNLGSQQYLFSFKQKGGNNNNQLIITQEKINNFLQKVSVSLRTYVCTCSVHCYVNDVTGSIKKKQLKYKLPKHLCLMMRVTHSDPEESLHGWLTGEWGSSLMLHKRVSDNLCHTHNVDIHTCVSCRKSPALCVFCPKITTKLSLHSTNSCFKIYQIWVLNLRLWVKWSLFSADHVKWLPYTTPTNVNYNG